MADIRNAHVPRPDRDRDKAHVEGVCRTGAPTFWPLAVQPRLRRQQAGRKTSGPVGGAGDLTPLRSFDQIHATNHCKDMADVIHW
ncbi:hypothetical protein PANO111632_14420 [Paracoccus nototheniae]